MTEKELKKLNRGELLQIMLEQSRRIDELEAENADLKERLQSRILVMEEAGSIAEASLRLNAVFEAAQEAADQYLESVRRLSVRNLRRITREKEREET